MSTAEVRHGSSERSDLHVLYENAPGFIATTEGPNHVFTFANAAYRRLVGRDALVGLAVADALPELAGQGFVERLDEVFRSGESFLGTSVPIRMVDPVTGISSLHYITFVYQPVRGPTGIVTGLFCEGHDVTAERVAAEQLAVLQAELIHVSRANAMGAMASTLAHELNQPLAAVAGYVAGCRRLIDPAAPQAAQLEQALRGADEAAQRAGEIIRNLRELTRRGRTTKARFNLKTAIGEGIRLVRAGGSPDVTFVDRTQDDVEMVADRVQILQVVINLLRNAADAADKSALKRVTVSAATSGRYLTVSVADTGSGVPVEVAKNIFSWVDSGKADGMGLGLSICRTIIEAHHGRIWLEDSSVSGSTFCFALPAAPTPDNHTMAVG